uniref:Ig-like domain-containing protein n=1 Tax=Electrophorus electricus TaxID=8005 RepID=A0AAY5EQ57_ELEEL
MVYRVTFGMNQGFILWAKGVNQLNSVTTAAFGENVTLQCFLLEEDNTDPIVWYQQKTGQEPRIMAMTQKSVETSSYYSEFKPPKFTIVKGKGFCHLNIASIEPSEEAMYYCGTNKYEIVFGKGALLSVKVSVVQSPVLGVVSPGESVSLQCTVLSERRTAELRVLWFRAAAGDSHPEIIYTHHNNSHQCEISSSAHSCVYNFSKSVLSLSDTGTYYCAVATCGKILLGNGTTVYIPLDPVVIFLGAALGVCVLVISAQAILICKRIKCEQSVHDITSPKSRNHNHSCNATAVLCYLLILPPQDHDAVELNYSALHFIDGKTRRRREKRGQTERSVYSEVLYSAATD